VYAAFIACVGGVCVHLAGYVTSQVVAVAAPQLAAWGVAPPSRVERREIEVASARKMTPSLRREPIIPDASPLPLHVLAAQLDTAERMEVSGKKRARRKVARPVAVAEVRSEGHSAADVFGRNFGVLLVASR